MQPSPVNMAFVRSGMEMLFQDSHTRRKQDLFLSNHLSQPVQYHVSANESETCDAQARGCSLDLMVVSEEKQDNSQFVTDRNPSSPNHAAVAKGWSSATQNFILPSPRSAIEIRVLGLETQAACPHCLNSLLQILKVFIPTQPLLHFILSTLHRVVEPGALNIPEDSVPLCQ